MDASSRPTGYYWVTFVGDVDVTVGFFDAADKTGFPWQVVGSDNIFNEKELTVLEAVKAPDKKG